MSFPFVSTAVSLLVISHGEATTARAPNSGPCTLFQIGAKKCGRERESDKFLWRKLFLGKCPSMEGRWWWKNNVCKAREKFKIRQWEEKSWMDKWWLLTLNSKFYLVIFRGQFLKIFRFNRVKARTSRCALATNYSIFLAGENSSFSLTWKNARRKDSIKMWKWVRPRFRMPVPRQNHPCGCDPGTRKKWRGRAPKLSPVICLTIDLTSGQRNLDQIAQSKSISPVSTFSQTRETMILNLEQRKNSSEMQWSYLYGAWDDGRWIFAQRWTSGQNIGNIECRGPEVEFVGGKTGFFFAFSAEREKINRTINFETRNFLETGRRNKSRRFFNVCNCTFSGGKKDHV